MSRYKQVATEYRSRESLLKALKEIFGANAVQSVTGTGNTLNLQNDYGHESQMVNLAVSRDSVRSILGKPGEYVYGVYGGLGFSWNGKAYEAVVDDLGEETVQPILNQIKQRYALNEVRRVASSKGYTLAESKQSDGSVTLTLVHR